MNLNIVKRILEKKNFQAAGTKDLDIIFRTTDALRDCVGKKLKNILNILFTNEVLDYIINANNFYINIKFVNNAIYCF